MIRERDLVRFEKMFARYGVNFYPAHEREHLHGAYRDGVKIVGRPNDDFIATEGDLDDLFSTNDPDGSDAAYARIVKNIERQLEKV
jgi:hypothetical protein